MQIASSDLARYEPLMRLIRTARWELPDGLRAVLTIPILNVAHSLDLTLQPLGDGEYFIDGAQLMNSYSLFGIEHGAVINERTNDWRYYDELGENLPWDFFELKNTIDLVEHVQGTVFEDAVEWLAKTFPNHSNELK